MSKKFLAVLIMGAVAVVHCGSGKDSNKKPSKNKDEIIYPLAPDFETVDINGNKVKLSDYRGKVVILDFWATWCPPCRYEIPGFVDLYSKNSNILMVIGVALDTGNDRLEKVKNFYKAFKMNYPVVMANEDILRKYPGISAIPTTFVIDKKGYIKRYYVGARPPDVFKKDLEELSRED